jgi:hypothetical protein
VICGANRNPLVAFYSLRRQEKLFRQNEACTAVPILNKGNFSALEIRYPRPDAEPEIARKLLQLEEAEIAAKLAAGCSKQLKMQLTANLA